MNYGLEGSRALRIPCDVDAGPSDQSCRLAQADGCTDPLAVAAAPCAAVTYTGTFTLRADVDTYPRLWRNVSGHFRDTWQKVAGHFYTGDVWPRNFRQKEKADMTFYYRATPEESSTHSVA